MSISPKLATASDLDDIAEFYISTRRYFSDLIPPIVGTTDGVRTWLANRVASQDEVWLVHDDLGLAALMILEPGWIDQLYVRPDLVGRGIGSFFVNFAKFRLPDGIQLWTFQSNSPAQKFYEKHGFVAVGFTDGQSNQEKAPDIRYQWLPPVHEEKVN
ncbi:MAG: GNAT family N-acetyltransferase [Actinomycetales bacterium]|nr:GNAT family N-acetyltransferase [Actinomycetales bacterium]